MNLVYPDGFDPAQFTMRQNPDLWKRAAVYSPADYPHDLSRPRSRASTRRSRSTSGVSNGS